MGPLSWLALAGCAHPYVHQPALAPTELSAPLPYRWVQVDGVDIAYLDSGGDGPVALLVHGLSAHAAFWEHQIEALSADHRLIVPDLPGFGASDRPDAPYTPPWFSDRLVALLDALDIDRVDYVGHSMGGQIGLTMALEHPDRVRSLALAAPAGIETFHPGHADWLAGYWTEPRALGSSEIAMHRSFRTLVFRRWDPGAERLLEERVRAGRHPSFAGTSVAVSRSVAGMLDHPVYDRLPSLSVPTLLVFGRRDGLIPNPILNGGRTETIARRGQRAIPGAELVLVPGAGHTVMHEAPEAFNEAVRAFWSSLAPTAEGP